MMRRMRMIMRDIDDAVRFLEWGVIRLLMFVLLMVEVIRLALALLR